MALVLGNELLDSGLGYVTSNADRIYVCNAGPTSYIQATTTYALGYKAFGVGAVAGAPQAATGGRKVITNAVTGGTIATGGTPAAWAIVDTVNSLLLASGSMSGAVAITTADAWALDPISLILTGALSGGPTFESETTAWVTAVGSGNVSAPRKTLVNDLIVGLKADGVWSKLDRLWLLAAENAASALVDIKASVLATAINSPVFTTDVGYTFNGSTNYIDTLLNTSAGGLAYVRDSAHISAFVSSIFNWAMMGNYVANSGAELGYYSAQWHTVGPNEDNTTMDVTAPATGLAILTRTASNARALYVNGTGVASGTDASENAGANQTLFLGGTSYLGGLIHPGAGQLAAASIGSGLDATDNANFYTRIRTYMTAVGVP